MRGPASAHGRAAHAVRSSPGGSSADALCVWPGAAVQVTPPGLAPLQVRSRPVSPASTSSTPKAGVKAAAKAQPAAQPKATSTWSALTLLGVLYIGERA